MKKEFPLKFTNGCWPLKKKSCGVCQRPLKDVVVYLNAGAIADLALDPPPHEAFWHCGIHTTATNCHNNIDIAIVDKLLGDQFYLSFCSINCLRDFFLSVIQQLESLSPPVSTTKGGIKARKRGRKGKVKNQTEEPKEENQGNKRVRLQ
jgi:hypothetical protein